MVGGMVDEMDQLGDLGAALERTGQGAKGLARYTNA
jgi:hypothetical protein